MARILAFSDLHGDTDAAVEIVAASSRADVVVGAGDFAVRGVGGIDTIEVLRRSPAPVVLVHGNHDVPEQLAAACADWRHGHYLHGGAVSLSGLRFFGLGGEVPDRTGEPWNTAETEAGAAALLAGCPAGAILVTHTPPLGFADVQRDGSHQGSAAIRDAVRKRRPSLHLCGHIHNAWGMTAKFGGTRIVNLGPRAVWFDV